MATETDSGIYLGLEIVRVGRRSKNVDGCIPDSRHDLIGQPALHTRSHMTGNTGDVLMGRLGPALIRRGNRVASGAERRVISKRYRGSNQNHRSDDKRQQQRGLRLPAHAPVVYEGTA